MPSWNELLADFEASKKNEWLQTHLLSALVAVSALNGDKNLPLSRGGSHTPGNVQLAHLGCNVAKGARVAVAA